MKFAARKLCTLRQKRREGGSTRRAPL